MNRKSKETTNQRGIGLQSNLNQIVNAKRLIEQVITKKPGFELRFTNYELRITFLIPKCIENRINQSKNDAKEKSGPETIDMKTGNDLTSKENHCSVDNE